jgi:hypothetical protein
MSLCVNIGLSVQVEQAWSNGFASGARFSGIYPNFWDDGKILIGFDVPYCDYGDGGGIWVGRLPTNVVQSATWTNSPEFAVARHIAKSTSYADLRIDAKYGDDLLASINVVIATNQAIIDASDLMATNQADPDPSRLVPFAGEWFSVARDSSGSYCVMSGNLSDSPFHLATVGHPIGDPKDQHLSTNGLQPAMIVENFGDNPKRSFPRDNVKVYFGAITNSGRLLDHALNDSQHWRDIVAAALVNRGSVSNFIYSAYTTQGLEVTYEDMLHSSAAYAALQSNLTHPETLQILFDIGGSNKRIAFISNVNSANTSNTTTLFFVRTPSTWKLVPRAYWGACDDNADAPESYPFLESPYLLQALRDLTQKNQ